MDTAQLDRILELQLAVAWAGESDTDPPRLGWWRTALCDQFGGEDLLRRLAPKTWEWAALEACRAAAKKVDGEARRSADDADHLLSLYRLGFEVDEHLDDRLLELKHSGARPLEALPGLAKLLPTWSKDRFEEWIGELEPVEHTATATGRRLKGEPPEEPERIATMLASAMIPLSERYALPHFRVKR